ncbi:MAG: alpha/beta fold hydrolase, partial [Planctomycetaceae bacterium]
PFRLLLLDRWPSIDRIGRVDAPVIVFHGTDDEMVPVEHGKALADAAVDGRLIAISGGSHNEIPTLKLRKELDAIAVSLRARRID